MTFWIPNISSSTLDTIDLFCGYGGWSTAAGSLGIWVRKALNHSSHAVYIHGINHPYTEHYLGNVKETRPSQHPTTALFLGSPTCTDFSQADPKNVLTLASEGQRRLFEEDQRAYEKLVAEHQGRATMFDVIEFTEHHRYHYGIIENVVDVHKWSLFEKWCQDLRNAGNGYNFKFLYLNGMFFHHLNGVEGMPIIPQSRDRWFCVFWRKGNPEPDLDFRPLAPCPECGDVRAIQVWKNPQKQWGKYGLKNGQYYYGCPNCKEKHRGSVRPLPVSPYYYAGINAVDWSVPILRVDAPERSQRISESTRRRIQAGLDKFGCEPIVIMANGRKAGEGVNKYRSALFEPLFTQTTSSHQGIAVPPAYLVDLAYGGGVKSGNEPFPTLTTSGTHAVVALPTYLVNLAHGGDSSHIRPGYEPLPTQTKSDTHGIVLAPTLLTDGGYNKIRPSMEPLPTQTTQGTQGVVVVPSSFLIELYGGGDARPVVDPINTVTAQAVKTGLCMPFFATYNSHSVITRYSEALPTITTVERHGMAFPMPTVDECYYRTLRSKVEKPGDHGTVYITSEIGAAMGFPQGPNGYKVEGSTDEITEGYGNAINPGKGKWIIQRVREAMER